MTPNENRRSEKSHRAILDAALDLCAELGYGRVTVEAIAARAGVSKKTIYRWWPSKGAVVLEAIIEEVPKSTGFPDTGDLVADLAAQMTAVLALVNGTAYLGVIAEAQHDDTLSRSLTRDLLQPRRAAAVERLRNAQARGQLPEDADLELVIDLLYAPLYYRPLLRLEPATSPERIQAIIDHVIRAVNDQE